MLFAELPRSELIQRQGPKPTGRELFTGVSPGGFPGEDDAIEFTGNHHPEAVTGKTP